MRFMALKVNSMTCTHATISDTNFVVGVIAALKKLTTTELKRSLRAGYRLNACYIKTSMPNHFLLRIYSIYHLSEDLAENANQLVVY